MAARNEFVEHVVESLALFGEVSVRRMFGGWGLYHEGVFFALIAGDILYLKADGKNARGFEKHGLEPFVFEKRRDGETIVTSYRRAPDEALEDPRVMARWAKSAYGAALRKEARKRAGKKPRV
jgi:DNA transformation protein